MSNSKINKNINRNKKKKKNNFIKKTRVKKSLPTKVGRTRTDERDMQLLGDVSSNDPSMGVSQRNVIKVEAPIDRNAFVALAAVWPLFAVKNSIPNDLVSSPSLSMSVGTIYYMFTGIAYDLYLATRNQVSMFSVMPRVYKELRDSFLPKAVGNTAYSWIAPETCFGTSGLINILQPYVAFASLSWPFVSGPLTRLYDFTLDGPITWNDNDVFNEAPNIIQNVWTNLNKRLNLDLIYPSVPTGYETCCGLFSQNIDLSNVMNLGWTGSVVEEVVPNRQYWTRFCGIVPFSDSPTTRTAIHIVNDYIGPHHYGGHLERYDFDPVTKKHMKTLYRPKNFSLEEVSTYCLVQMIQGDLYSTSQETSISPATGPNSIFNSMSQSQFLRYIMVLCATRFTQEGWAMFNFKTCNNQVSLVAGVNLTPYSDTYNMPIPRSVAEFFGGLGVKISTYRNKKGGGYRFVTIPQISVYGNTLANCYQNMAYAALSNIPTASDMLSLLTVMNPSIIASPGFSFLGTDNTMPDYLNIDTSITANSVNLSQVQGTSVFDGLQQVGDNFSTLKGFMTISVNVANKDDVPFTVMYYCRQISDPLRDEEFSLIYLSTYSQLTNRVNFDQRVLGSHLGVPLPLSCTPLPLHQVIFSEYSVTEVNNIAPFFKQTVRSAQEYVHPKESTSDTSDFTLMNEGKTAQGHGGNFIKKLGGIFKMISPIAGGIIQDLIPGGKVIGSVIKNMVEKSNRQNDTLSDMIKRQNDSFDSNYMRAG